MRATLFSGLNRDRAIGPGKPVQRRKALGMQHDEYDLVIKGGRVVSSEADFVADVAVTGETIAAIGTGLRGRREIDAAGKLVLPGAIDGHVHMRTERDRFTYDETFATGTLAAAFGGTTTIIDQIQPEPGIPLPEAFRTRLAMGEGESCIDFAFHMNFREEMDRLAEIPEIVAAGITSFKWFMSVPPWAISDEFLMKCMFTLGDLGALCILHAENQGALDAMRWRRPVRGMPQFPDNFPPGPEAAAITLALSMAEVTDCRTLIFHNTCAEAVEAIRAAKARGVRAYGEVCLAWLTHTAEVFEGDPVAALAFLLAPPLRAPEHRAALWKGLRAGDLDIVSTDHAVMRRMPEADALEFAAYFGLRFDVPPPDETTPRDAAGNRLMPMLAPGGVETRLPLMYSLGVLGGHIDLHRWVETCCAAPARLFDLHGKGHLLPGYDADIVIFDPDATRTYSVGTLHSNTDHSVWDGWTCRGVVETTICRGSLVVENGRFVGSKAHGRFLRRSVDRPDDRPSGPVGNFEQRPAEAAGNPGDFR